MQRLFLIAVGLIALLSSACAGNAPVSSYPAATTLAGGELVYCIQSGASKKCTVIQLATYVFGQVSGDVTCTGGACTVTKTNGVAFGTLATQSAPTGLTQCLHASSLGVVTGTGVDCGAGGGGVTSISAGCGLSTGGSPITTTGTVSASATINPQVGTSYTVLSTDCGKVVTLTNSSPVAVTVPIASAAGFGSTFYATFINEGAGLATLTPTTSTIDGAASLTLAQGQSVDLITDGTNYFTLRGRPTNVAIASGTAVLGTSAIGSAACATVVTVAATGVLTTDVVTASFNGDPTAVTGYIPATAGMLTILTYPTSGNVNFKVCNNTSGSVTPGAITLNWRVVR